MARRETAVHYLLEHRVALLLAGFVLLIDQLFVDWGQSLASGGTRELAHFGPFGIGVAAPLGLGTLVVTLLLGTIGVAGLLYRGGRIRLATDSETAAEEEDTRPRSGPAVELLVLAGFVAAAVNMALRGTTGAPIVVEPLGWGLPPALLVALPAALVLAAQCGADRPRARTGSTAWGGGSEG